MITQSAKETGKESIGVGVGADRKCMCVCVWGGGGGGGGTKFKKGGRVGNIGGLHKIGGYDPFVKYVKRL